MFCWKIWWQKFSFSFRGKANILRVDFFETEYTITKVKVTFT